VETEEVGKQEEGEELLPWDADIMYATWHLWHSGIAKGMLI
jgi:hypothetical protein